jgi:hypothetical protein
LQRRRPDIHAIKESDHVQQEKKREEATRGAVPGAPRDLWIRGFRRDLASCAAGIQRHRG